MDVEPVDEAVRDEYEPGYEPRVRWPSGALLAYQDWLHTPRWLMGALALLVAAATLLCVTRCAAGSSAGARRSCSAAWRSRSCSAARRR